MALFDLSHDIGETTNLAAEHPQVVEHLMALIEAARDDLGDALTHRAGRHVRAPGTAE